MACLYQQVLRDGNVYWNTSDLYSYMLWSVFKVSLHAVRCVWAPGGGNRVAVC